MFEQDALAAAAAPDDRKGLTARDIKIDTPQDFLLTDCFHQPLHGDHRTVVSIWRAH